MMVLVTWRGMCQEYQPSSYKKSLMPSTLTALNLACQDAIHSVKVVKDAPDITFELSKLLKYSSKSKATSKAIRKQL